MLVNTDRLNSDSFTQDTRLRVRGKGQQASIEDWSRNRLGVYSEGAWKNNNVVEEPRRRRPDEEEDGFCEDS